MAAEYSKEILANKTWDLLEDLGFKNVEKVWYGVHGAVVQCSSLTKGDEYLGPARLNQKQLKALASDLVRWAELDKEQTVLGLTYDAVKQGLV